ncbi:hypothetical protein KKR91_03645 [Arthrobacter jiangjiafuii]|uniref:AIPR protein n=1 Tax=Arthrobacter jiangjiafuii TaxID=2817475 RepID=A0A975R0A3_9MICC|nr:hypothetical protein [Arthrobacter jiangjiafuii]MBP3043698.1 hypothetical protein [Arthrobacter jiangjiafuii]QWC10730.1 hypothetical protein KKR91_03645 [Arthrobacter jiangjiafuii]
MPIETLSADTSTIIKFEDAYEQSYQGILRVIGLAKISSLIATIDSIDLEANPRSSRVGPITAAIRESIESTPEVLPFKTKGVLLGASKFERLQRHRYRLSFQDVGVEGILDGGHNMLAFGLHILDQAGVLKRSNKPKNWTDFKAIWHANRSSVETLRKSSEEDKATWDAVVPVEVLLPNDPDSPEEVAKFNNSLLDICAARNNNAQLRSETKSNQSGHYEYLKSQLPDSLNSSIEWKTNDGGKIKVADVVALAWIPLSLVSPMPNADDGRVVEPPVPQNIYRSKGDCIVRFERLMSSPAVSENNGTDYKAKLVSKEVKSALGLVPAVLDVYDLISENYAKAYNTNDGIFGRIKAVQSVNKGDNLKTKFMGRDLDTRIPDGFLIPVVYGLRSLMERTDDGQIKWKVDPREFVKQNLPAIMATFKTVITLSSWDPQKVGKEPGAYIQAENAFEMALLRSSSKA